MDETAPPGVSSAGGSPADSDRNSLVRGKDGVDGSGPLLSGALLARGPDPDRGLDGVQGMEWSAKRADGSDKYKAG